MDINNLVKTATIYQESTLPNEITDSLKTNPKLFNMLSKLQTDAMDDLNHIISHPTQYPNSQYNKEFIKNKSPLTYINSDEGEILYFYSHADNKIYKFDLELSKFNKSAVSIETWKRETIR